jgi:Zn-dependent protease
MHLYWQEAILNVVLLCMLTAPHEFAHAWVATRLGDDTPRLQGRVTLNPLAHIDRIGTVLLPLITSLMGAGFIGWGKPVYTTTSKLRGGLNGLLLVALAGPASNIVLAVLMGALTIPAIWLWQPAAAFLVMGIRLSLYLAIFNLLPVPPLDGSKLLLAARIPPAIYIEIARFGFLALLVLFQATNLGRFLSQWSDWGTVRILELFGR